MNSRDRVDRENISFEFNVSNSSWHIIIKVRITIKNIKLETKKKEKNETDPDSNLTRAMSKLRRKNIMLSK